jgi:hypothetical protein
MIIRSKFVDYYDYMAKHGVDKTVVYDRNSKVIASESEATIVQPLLNKNSFRKDFIELMYIGWCGTFIPIAMSGYYTEYYFSLESIISTRFKPYENHRHYNKYAYEKVVKHFESGFENHDLFKEHKAPLIVLCQADRYSTIDRFAPYGEWDKNIDNKTPGKVLITNPVMEIYKSFKPPHIAYQEIQSYLSGVLGGLQEYIPEVPDEVRYEGKGFDGKMGFRKDSPDTPKRRKHRLKP